MFYVPDESNDEYSQGFRKLIGRILSKIRQEQKPKKYANNENSKLSSTIDYTRLPSKGRKTFLDKKSIQATAIKSQASERISERRSLPKISLLKQKVKINVRGQQVSFTNLKQENQHINKLIQKYSPEKRTKSKEDFSHRCIRRKSTFRARKLKSQCVQQFDQERFRVKGQDITPWDGDPMTTHLLMQ